MNQIRLVVCDVEGCLTVNKGQPMDVGTLVKIQAYCELARRGEKPPLVACTGRPQPYVEAILQTLDAFFPNFPSVVENGCFLYDPCSDVILPNPAIEGKASDLKRVRSFIDERFIISRIAKAEPGKELCISLNPLNGMMVDNLCQQVKEALPDELRTLVFITHSSSAVDITPVGVNKASGLEFLSQRTGIAFPEMLGIGDTAGDFPMLKRVGIPCCPGNAKDEVKQLVRNRNGYVATQPNTLGVWEILLNFDLMNC